MCHSEPSPRFIGRWELPSNKSNKDISHAAKEGRGAAEMKACCGTEGASQHIKASKKYFVLIKGGKEKKVLGATL